VVGAVALAAACRFIDSLPASAVEAHEGFLVDRLVTGLASVDGVRPLRLWPGGLRLWPGGADRIGVVTFTVAGWPAQHLAQYLSAEHGIGVRDGRFCAHPLLARLTPDGAAVRASLGLGSRAADVDRLVDALGALRARGPAWAYAGAADGYAPVPDPRVLPDWLAGHPSGPAAPCAG